MNFNKKHPHWWHYLVLSVLAYFVLFLKLGSFHIRMWDESMFAVNTYEMLKNGNYFSLYYDGIVDLYNTKPPLTNWLQLISVKIFGFNELAIRLPSALAAFFTIIFSFKFTAKYFDYFWAWIVVLIILSSAGFVGFHTARTGESDSILTLFLLLANVAFIEFILQSKKKYILYFFLFLTIAFATKLFAAFLFIPAYLFLLIYYKKIKKAIFSWQFLVGLVIFIGISITLILLREMESLGYLDIILSNDIGRLFVVPKGFEKTNYFYIENFFTIRFSIYFIFFIIGSLFLFIKRKENHTQKILVMYFVLIATYLLIISLSVTKLPWYDMPLYPLLALIAALPIIELINSLLINTKNKIRIAKYLIIALIFFYPYYYRSSKSQGNKIDDGAILIEANGRYLFHAMRENTNLDNLKVLFHGYNGSLLFYKYKLHEQGQEIELHKNVETLNIGNKVLVCKDEHRVALQEKFKIAQIDNYQSADVYILNEKTDTLH